MLKTITSILLLFIGLNVWAQKKPEMRAVWIATVANIDWPSKPTISSEVQKAEFIKMLDMHKRNGMNTVIVQVRPCADAFYPSSFEPWSQWLTGVQGQPPFPYYDPMQFMIEETHKRGMEFHAWMNPYRAVFNLTSPNLSATHITKVHPEWFVQYGDKRYFDPGNKEVMAYVNDIVRDVVKRYDVDAIHFDDYFYPYRIAGKEFPDAASFAKYGKGMNKDEWRRSNTDSIIYQLYRTIKEVNPECDFGISPFGVWRNASVDPRGSNTQAGQTNYDDLYADVLLWQKNKWIDYITPQLYWEIGHKLADFNTLVDWWNANTYGVKCYIGIGMYRAGSSAVWRDKNELPRQIRKVRSTENLGGFAFFSSKSFNDNPNGWNDSLRLNYFREQVPAN